MPALSWAQRRAGRELGSLGGRRLEADPVVHSDRVGRRCWSGLLLNSLFGWSAASRPTAGVEGRSCSTAPSRRGCRGKRPSTCASEQARCASCIAQSPHTDRVRDPGSVIADPASSSSVAALNVTSASRSDVVVQRELVRVRPDLDRHDLVLTLERDPTSRSGRSVNTPPSVRYSWSSSRLSITVDSEVGACGMLLASSGGSS